MKRPRAEKGKGSPLSRRLLSAAHVAWVATAVLAAGIFALSIPPYFWQQTAQIHPIERAVLQQIGLSANFITLYIIALDGAVVLAFALVAIGIFWRTARDWVALFVSFALFTFGVAISPTLDALSALHPWWKATVTALRLMSISTTLAVFYIFPDGRFAPRWTRILFAISGGWALAWVFFTSPFDFAELPPLVRFVVFLFTSNASFLGRAYQYLRLSTLLLDLLICFAIGLFAQVYRYRKISTPLQRQQTKWVVFGLTAAVIGYFAYFLPQSLIAPLREPGLARVLFTLIGSPLSVGLLVLAPLSIGLSIAQYRLWDIDPIIHRTLVYGMLTAALAILYFGGVLLFQQLFRAITGYQSTLAIAISTLVIASLFQPLRSRLQDFIDRRFYRERVDFRQSLSRFSRQVRTLIDLPELLEVLVERTMELFHSTHGAVFLRNEGGHFQLLKAQNLSVQDLEDASGADSSYRFHLGEGGTLEETRLSLPTAVLDQLRHSRVISQPHNRTFPLLVPLTAPRAGANELVGVLALGPRLSGQSYSREDQALLMSLADQAGTAIHVARLIQEKQDEARRREAAERRLEAQRNSPLGQAQAFAEALLFAPHTALVELYRLASRAGQEALAAAMLDNLPRVLENIGAQPIARLAEGLNYLFRSQFEPEMLPIGLRTLTTQLESYPPQGLQYVCRWTPGQTAPAGAKPSETALQHGDQALHLYRLCRQALEANSIAQITRLESALQEVSPAADSPFHELGRCLGELRTVAEALHAYERLDTSQDKLAYLARAVEGLRTMDHLARAELRAVDRAVVQRLAESWLAVITGAMSDLQTRAQIACRLLTRHTWQGDAVPLVLGLRNEGRGAALNLKIALEPAAEYTLLDQVAQLERLAPGEEARVELRVRPHLPPGADQFRARFVVLYTDPRGSDQVENFADVVRLLSTQAEFTFIPNPYVVGTPLEGGSPLFFGREDVFAFIQENLNALHRNNLVLIGQRRTGKTSLLKQLPVRLGDAYLPVYLDGQALALDPGMTNFFLSLATEIAFALEDRGFQVDIPTYDELTTSPAASFEHQFLPRVRQAIGSRHLLFMFDEFEELETAVQRGHLDPSIFGFLRHLVQHVEQLSVIFCGTHRLEELAADYWSVLFNISLYRHIAFLEKPAALRLVQEPVAPYGMRYDDLALDKIWQVTAGHPYFLQLLCHSLVNHHNRTERNYLTVADVNTALDEILASGEAHFVYLWTEATPEDRLVLAAMSRMIPLSGRVTPVQVADYLNQRGVRIERRAISDALHHLTLRDILFASSEMDPTVGETYGWRLGLLGLWVEKYKSMSRVVDEIKLPRDSRGG